MKILNLIKKRAGNQLSSNSNDRNFFVFSKLKNRTLCKKDRLSPIKIASCVAE